MISRLLPSLWYPLIFGSAILAFGLLLQQGVNTFVAAYVPIIISGLAILLLEMRFPERADWQPRLADIKADIAFMAVVQIALPRALAALMVIALAGWTHARTPSDWWPHQLPLAIQVILIVLIVDFTRYWLHRACHRYILLWRLHEVHHSPDLLYILNVGRFHPLEKVLHLSLDTLPFVLLGVDPQAIAGYFLLYSVNGFFQHSNVRLRYGWLNYVVGSAQTHRWHHARDPKTAHCNFGNTTIIWDLLFGTWYLPKGPGVGDIGIPDRTYPKGFLQQMATPFRTRKDER